MDLETLDWDDELLGVLRHPARDAAGDPAVVRPERVRRRRWPNGPLGGEVPLTGDLGDQQAATVGQVCFAPGEAKNTYGTGNFMLLNTGTELVRSKAGLLTTVCYKFGDEDAGLRAGGLDRGDRLGRAVAARPARHHLRRGGDRDAGPAGRGQRRRLLRARVLRPVRAVLALRRPRRDRRAVPVQHQRAPGPGHAGGDLLPEPRRRRRDGEGLRASTLDVLKVDGGVTANELCMQIQADILGVAGEQAGRRRDHRARRGVRGRAGGRASGTTPTSCGQNWNEDKRWAPELERRAARGRGTPAGRRPSSARWTGWTSTDAAGVPDGGAPWEPPSHCHRRPGPRRWTAMADDRSSTSWWSAAGWSAPARRSTPPPAGLSVGLVEARDWPAARPAGPAS